MIGICRGCTNRTDGVLHLSPGTAGFSMCNTCQEKWGASGERARAEDILRRNPTKMGQEVYTTLVRPFVDFLYRLQKERLEMAGKAVGA